MPWLALLSAGDPSPADNVLGPAVQAFLGYGITGVLLLVLAWLFYKGWRLVPPDKEAAGREAARAEARADLLEERARVLAEKTRIEQERDEALKFTQSNLVPLLLNFTNATSALIPLLQELVRYREGGNDIDPRRRR